MLLEQVRFQKAHKAIGDEIRTHIEDQVQANISEGMDKETAEKRAVEDMGDPVEAGIRLDKVHRPQIAWGVIIIAIVVGVLGAIVNGMLSKQPAEATYNNIVYSVNVRGGESYIYDAILGIFVMVILYLIDFTTVAKYSRVAAITLLVSYIFSSFVTNKRAMMLSTDYYAELPKAYMFLYKIFSWSSPMMFLMVPFFAGILYKYRGQKSRAVIKALLWIVATGRIAAEAQMTYRTVVILICMLVELTIAINKGWIKVPKIPTVVSVWSLFTVIPMGITWFRYKHRLMDLNGMSIVRSWIVPDSDMRQTREILGGMNLIGSGMIRSFGGKISVPTSNYVHGNYGREYVLTDIIALWGLLATLVAITAVAALIVFGFVTISKTKNQLGIVMGSGCMMWLAVNAIFNAGVGFGIFHSCYWSFFPFIAQRKIVASYAILGIILSIYKYKNAYSEHVDICIDKKMKVLDLQNILRIRGD